MIYHKVFTGRMPLAFGMPIRYNSLVILDKTLNIPKLCEKNFMLFFLPDALLSCRMHH